MRRRLRTWLRETVTYKWARRIVVAVIGGSIVLIGFAMIVLPGPAILVIPLGLGVLGLEFAWARFWLKRLRTTANGFVNNVRGRRLGAAPPPPQSPRAPPPGPNPPDLRP